MPELHQRVVSGIQQLAWQGLLSAEDALALINRVRQLAARSHRMRGTADAHSAES